MLVIITLIRLFERLRVQHGECLGASLWASSRLLTHFLGAYLPALGAHGKGMRVLELGCGVGLPGIYCALQGCSVTLTDKDEVTSPAPTCVVTLLPLSAFLENPQRHGCKYMYTYVYIHTYTATHCNTL